MSADLRAPAEEQTPAKPRRGAPSDAPPPSSRGPVRHEVGVCPNRWGLSKPAGIPMFGLSTTICETCAKSGPVLRHGRHARRNNAAVVFCCVPAVTVRASSAGRAVVTLTGGSAEGLGVPRVDSPCRCHRSLMVDKDHVGDDNAGGRRPAIAMGGRRGISKRPACSKAQETVGENGPKYQGGEGEGRPIRSLPCNAKIRRRIAPTVTKSRHGAELRAYPPCLRRHAGSFPFKVRPRLSLCPTFAGPDRLLEAPWDLGSLFSCPSSTLCRPPKVFEVMSVSRSNKLQGLLRTFESLVFEEPGRRVLWLCRGKNWLFKAESRMNANPEFR